MTKQRKMYAAFLGLAASAFLCDRLFFGGEPQGAEAAPSEEVAAEAPRTEATAKKGPAGPVLAAKLEKAAQGVEPGRDPFRTGVGGSGVKDGVGADPITSVDFVQRFELQSVLTPSEGSKARGVAIVANQRAKGARTSGRAVAVGRMHAGWVLVEVTDKSATFERDSARAMLELKSAAKVDNREPTKPIPAK